MTMRTVLFTIITTAMGWQILTAQARWEATYLPGTWDDEAVSGMELPDGRFLFHFASVPLPGEDVQKRTMLLGPKGELLALDTAAQHLQSFTGPYFFPDTGHLARMLGYWVVLDTSRLFNVLIDSNLQHNWQGYVEVPYAGFTLMEGDSNFVVARDEDCGLKFYKGRLDGTVFWEKTVEETDLGNCAGYLATVSMIEVPGGYVASMIFRDFFPDTYYLFIVKISNDGEVLWKYRQQTDALRSPSLAWTGGSLFVLQNNQLRKLGGTGAELANFNLTGSTGSALSNGHLARQLGATSDGQLVLTGKTPYNATTKGNAFLLKLDTLGQVVWYADPGITTAPEEGQRIFPLADGGYLMTGKRYANNAENSPGDAYFVRTDGTGSSLTAQVRGRVFLDENANCLADPGEMGLPGIPLRLTWAGQPTYQMSEPDGSFTFDGREGNVTLELGGDNPYLKPCWASSVFLLSQFDTFSLDFPIKPTAICPLPKVSLASWPMVPCEANRYLLGYRNDGLDTLFDASLEGYFPTELIDLQPNTTFTSPTPGMLHFQLGNLPPGTNGQVEINFTVGCDVPLGQKTCAQARLLPSDYCTGNPAVLGDPPHFAEDCKNVVSAPLPTVEKLPTAGSQTKIGRDSTLSYLIHFQNNTSETVQQVVITDTLASAMLPLTVSLLNSSHPCTFEYGSGNAVRFVFDSINLPHSGQDSLGSRGFVQFEVGQKAGLSRNFEIKNRASVKMGTGLKVPTNQVVQKVDFPDYFFPFDTVICPGEKIFNFKVFSDSILYKTYLKPEFDSVLVAHVAVDGAWVVQHETVTAGSYFLGIPVTSDTVFKQVFPLPGDCDSTVVTFVGVVSGSIEEKQPEASIQLQPNPIADEAKLRVMLPKPEAVHCSAHSALGQIMWQFEGKNPWASGEHLLRLPVADWPSGVYFLVVQFPEKQEVIRFSKL